MKVSLGIKEGEQKHFADVFFNPLVVDEAVVESMPQYVIILKLDILPAGVELDLAISDINTGKERGLDGIAVELLQRRVRV